MNKNVLYLI